jgi:poly(A) polymerase
VVARLVKIEAKPDALRRLAALLASASDSEALARKLKFSNADRERLVALAEPVPLTSDAAAQRQLLHRLGRDLYADRVLLSAAVANDAANVKKLLGTAAKWKPLAFPLRGADIAAAGVPEGPSIGKLLAEIEAWWEAGDFKATRKQCLSELQRRLHEAAAPA